MGRCTCKSCERHRAWDKIIQGDDIEKLRELTRNIVDSLLGAEEDANYYSAIIDGSWPEADEIIAFRRERLKTK